jgi:formate dehydrogenase assembly factor FdhD
VREKFVETLVRVRVHAHQHVAEVCLQVDAVRLARGPSRRSTASGCATTKHGDVQAISCSAFSFHLHEALARARDVVELLRLLELAIIRPESSLHAAALLGPHQLQCEIDSITPDS